MSRLRSSIQQIQQIQQISAIGSSVSELRAELRDARLLDGRILAELHRSKDDRDLRAYEFKVFSQWGEDGIVQHLTASIEVANHTFVEFGVGDFSEANCRFLLEKDNWSGYVLDADAAAIQRLRSHPDFWRFPLEAAAAHITRENVATLLEASGLGPEPGILSVDVDGVDYHLLEALHAWRPGILIVEFNAVFGGERAVTIPYDPSFDRTRAHGSWLYSGASLPAFEHLARSRGYALVGITSQALNAFFVRRDLLNERVPEVRVADVFTPSTFRDSHGPAGELTLVAGAARRDLIADMPLIDVMTGEQLTVRDLPVGPVPATPYDRTVAATDTVHSYIVELARRARGETHRPLEARAIDTAGLRGSHVRIAAQSTTPPREFTGNALQRLVKTLVGHAYRRVTPHQERFNHAVVAALSEFDTVLGGSSGGSVAVALASLEVLVQDLSDQHDALRAQLAAAMAGSAGFPQALDRRYDDLYAAFEDVFRGSRDEVRSRCAVYVEELAAVAAAGAAPVVDLGCGRGELLELLHNAGVRAYGVDTNATSVAATSARGIHVVQEDALAHLRDVEPASLAAVTALHLVEHVPLPVLVDLVDAALRALRPGGLLLLETPNPTTWQVGASAFYLDPTHVRPLHPLFLHFLLSARGFGPVEVRYLHPADDTRIPVPVDGDVLTQVVERFNAVYSGPQDYAVVGVKPDAPH